MFSFCASNDKSMYLSLVKEAEYVQVKVVVGYVVGGCLQ
jgi:hypothetical protein